MLVTERIVTRGPLPFRALSRRLSERRRLGAAAVHCWSRNIAPCEVSIIEADDRGARLLLPRQTRPGEVISVSFSDGLGHYRTVKARVCWVHPMQWTQRVVAGLAFEEALEQLA